MAWENDIWLISRENSWRYKIHFRHSFKSTDQDYIDVHIPTYSKQSVVIWYLIAISFHEQHPSASSTFSKLFAWHVTVHRNLPRWHLEEISFVFLGPYNKRIVFLSALSLSSKKNMRKLRFLHKYFNDFYLNICQHSIAAIMNLVFPFFLFDVDMEGICYQRCQWYKRSLNNIKIKTLSSVWLKAALLKFRNISMSRAWNNILSLL